MKKIETEAEWLTCTDPAEMLRFLRLRGRKSARYIKPAWFAYYKKDLADRKFRLLLLACCQRLCSGSASPLCDQLFQMVKRFVETPPPLLRRNEAIHPFFGAADDLTGVIESSLRQSVGLALAQLRLYIGRKARMEAGKGEPALEAERLAIRTEAEAQCELLRDVYGNPLRPVKLDPAWVTEEVVKLAQAIYDQQCFDRMPDLADVLDETGCTNKDVLAHCRQPGKHVQGCWVVDLLLGKEKRP